MMSPSDISYLSIVNPSESGHHVSDGVTYLPGRLLFHLTQDNNRQVDMSLSIVRRHHPDSDGITIDR